MLSYIEVMNKNDTAISPSRKTETLTASMIASPWLPIGLLLMFYLIIGAVTVVDYGESWDEQKRYLYATQSLAAYSGDYVGLRTEKGPFYVMIAKLGSDFLRRIFTGWLPIESWHFMHFLSYLLGIFFFYVICLRFLNKWAAMGAVLLFSTQPLIWGHAFINPKDIPFMAFFLGSVALGFQMVDAALAVPGAEKTTSERAELRPASLRQRLTNEWNERKPGTKHLLGAMIGFLVVSLAGIIILSPWIRQAIADLIQQAYTSGSNNFLGRIFLSQAENINRIPLEAYIHKGVARYNQLLGLFIILVSGLILLLGIILFPKSAKEIWHSAIKPSHNVTSVLLAGIMLGLVTAIRPLGPAAGALVALYFLLKAGWISLPTLAAYFAIALLVTYLTWPSLWGSPIKTYIWSLSESSDFPWGGKVLFNGIDLELNQIPRSYMPKLMTLQFTETSLALFLAGLVVVVIQSFKQTVDWKSMLVLSTWAFLPLLAVIVFRPTLYDNFRHFFFILPPLFLIAGIGLQAILDRLRSPLWKTLVVALAIFPGVYGMITLHPYQYVYYNRLAGGLQGAFRRYEMDYWATSYREAIEFLNNTAPKRSKVIVWGPDQAVRKFARRGLVIREYHPEESSEIENADYAIISTRYNKDLYLFPEGKTILEIGRGGAVLTVVKQLQEADAQE